MSVLQVLGNIETGVIQFDTGISQLMTLNGAANPVLMSVSGSAGGIVSFSLVQGSLPVEIDHAYITFSEVTGTGPTLTTLQTSTGFEVLVGGVGNGGVEAFGFDLTGHISNGHNLQGLNGNDPVQPIAVQVGSGTLVLANPQGDGFTTYTLNGAGGLDNPVVTTDTAATHATHIGEVATAQVNGVDILLTASTSEFGVTAYVMGTGGPVAGGSIGQANGLGIMVPTDMQIVTLASATFVIIASAPANAGASGALSVMQVDENGTLTPTDHVLDTLDTRFGQVQAIATVTVDGRAYVVAGGGDMGVSLFHLTEDGQLVHLESLAGSIEAGFEDITAIEILQVGNELQVFIATEGDAGITVLTIALGSQGLTLKATEAGEVLAGQGNNDILNGHDGNDVLTGGGGDDILIDGAGSDSLTGGSGADMFILEADGVADSIEDFNPAQDHINLSSWVMLYDPNSLTIIATADGALIIWRDEVLTLHSHNGEPLDITAVRQAIVLDLNRSFYAPTMALDGTIGDDILIGDWGSDNIFGDNGNDTLNGGGGDDILNGGNNNDLLDGGDGVDTAIFEVNFASASVIDLGNGTVRITSAQGIDELQNIEIFVFNDLTLSLPELLVYSGQTLMGDSGANTLTGGAGRDTLYGYGGHDTLDGGDEDDEIYGGDGNDLLIGGAGDDDLDGGDGSDSVEIMVNFDSVLINDLGDGRVRITSALGIDTITNVETFIFADAVLSFDEIIENSAEYVGGQTMTGSSENDTLSGGLGDDHISGYSGNDFLYGSGGDDNLYGNKGDDRIYGDDGDDFINGGKGNDSIKGGDGNDIMNGGDGNDYIRGQTGDDIIDGGNGNDYLVGHSGFDTITGGDGIDTIKGHADDDNLYGGGGNDVIRGNANNDLLDGGDGDDILIGHGGDDSLTGGAGNDDLRGGGGFDTLDGGAGDDRLFGKRNDDILTGGTGADTFVFLTGGDHDRITDFDTSEDFLELDAAYWNGISSAAAFLATYATVTSAGVVFNFGGGDTLTLDGVTSLTGLDAVLESG